MAILVLSDLTKHNSHNGSSGDAIETIFDCKNIKLIGLAASLVCLFDVVVGGGSLGNGMDENDHESTSTHVAKAIRLTIPTKPVESIILLGERHSGTNWITDHLMECFQDQVKVCFERITLKLKCTLIYF